MTYTTSIQEFLAGIYPFDQLSPSALTKLSSQGQLLRYRMGQPIVIREKMPPHISILFQGQARLLGYDPRGSAPITLKLLQPGEIIGWVSVLRGIPCETAIASVESVCFTLNIADFLRWLDSEPVLASAFRSRCALIEIFELLGTELARRAETEANLKALALQALSNSVILNVAQGKQMSSQLDPNRVWMVSGGASANVPVGSCLNSDSVTTLIVNGSGSTRLVGIPSDILSPATSTPPGLSAIPSQSSTLATLDDDIPYADAQIVTTSGGYLSEEKASKRNYPFVRGRGSVDATVACFQMLSQYFGMPFRRDIIRRVITTQEARSGNLSLMHCGAVGELMGLSAQLVNVPSMAVSRLPTPVLLSWQDSFAILYESSERELVLAVPESGIKRIKPSRFIEDWGDEGQALLLKATKSTPKERFGLNWFIPSIIRYRRVLTEVLIASFFVQLFGLANPLMIQLIIDKVIVQNSINTLHVLGVLLVAVAIFEGLLTSLRTYLFVDTTNRIDMALGSEIIDHLLRLPLRYFERRPVGELATRIGELENIRQFLTGTALTVVLDAVFSVVYIVVMFIYSWLLTLVTLAVIPLFILLTVVVSPIVRQQLRTKAERQAETQSYLVEVLSGISTVKAQNIELRARWKWQERYGRYVSDGFKNVLTSTAASSTSNFLNKLSALLVLWVGAYLVLDGQLSLGQLIAFRIISGYVTGPLLRLAQIWQNFQQTALSLERLSDIVDSPQEADETDRYNIALPPVEGTVKYEDVSFRFGTTGPLQLNNINIEIPAGTFVGIVGQSGSGKSTLTKLLPRLYDPLSGRIIVDGYDISKVELYSLRRQIGIVPQETLLFDGTVQENIALTNPDASSEEIIEAARVAAAHDFIMELPSGYNTRVGERGSALSGGQ
ncbi:MAG TPA: peptidase domain-containing ABC transporter, partial [Stenomitos sp.]